MLDTVSVLVVEDEAILRDALVRWLTDRGFDVTAANDCASGIDHAIQERPNAILLDLKLPDAPGLELLRTLRRRDIAIPFVLFTGKASPADGFEAGSLGYGQFLEKPASPDKIADSLREVAGRPRWDAAVALRQLSRQIDVGQADLDTLVLRTIELLADPRVGLVEFSSITLLVKDATTDPSTLRLGLLRTAGLIESSRKRIKPPMSQLLRSMAEAPDARRDRTGPARRIRHEVHQATGRRFSSWQRLARLRLAVQELVHSDEHVAQVAYRLGFPRGGQLTRDLHCLLGSSPRELRHMLRAEVGQKQSDSGH